MLCILYVNLITACFGIAALLVERALPTAWPRRWIWCGAIAVSMALPGIYRAHHAWDVAGASAHHPRTMLTMLDRAGEQIEPGEQNRHDERHGEEPEGKRRCGGHDASVVARAYRCVTPVTASRPSSRAWRASASPRARPACPRAATA